MYRVSVRRPWDALQWLDHQMTRWLQRDLDSQEIVQRDSVAGPLMNVFELDQSFVVTVELPGHHPDEVVLDLADDTLTLSGYRRDAQEVPDEQFRRQERWQGRWKREITLPTRVEPSSASASMVDGRLTVVLGKAKASPSKRIAINKRAPRSSGDDMGQQHFETLDAPSRHDSGGQQQ